MAGAWSSGTGPAMPPLLVPVCPRKLPRETSGKLLGRHSKTGRGALCTSSQRLGPADIKGTLGPVRRQWGVSTSALGVGSGESEGTLGALGGAGPEAGADAGSGSEKEEEEEGGKGSPRRSVGVQFTCNKCQQQTTRYVNPLALTKGTIFLQCANAACNAMHKIVDNLNLIDEINYKEEEEKRKKEEEAAVGEKDGRAAGA